MTSWHDRTGAAAAFVDDLGAVFTPDGDPVGYVHDRGLYAYSGAFIGYLDAGRVHDLRGDTVFLAADSREAPLRDPLPPPARAVRALRPLRPPLSPRWSDLDPGAFLHGELARQPNR